MNKYWKCIDSNNVVEKFAVITGIGIIIFILIYGISIIRWMCLS